MKDHALLTVLYAVALGLFFGTLWKDAPRERVRHGAVITVGLILGAIAVAWLMTLAYRKG